MCNSIIKRFFRSPGPRTKYLGVKYICDTNKIANKSSYLTKQQRKKLMYTKLMLKNLHKHKKVNVVNINQKI